MLLLVHNHMFFQNIPLPDLCHVTCLSKFPCYLYLDPIVQLDIRDQMFKCAGSSFLFGALIIIQQQAQSQVQEQNLYAQIEELQAQLKKTQLELANAPRYVYFYSHSCYQASKPEGMVNRGLVYLQSRVLIDESESDEQIEKGNNKDEFWQLETMKLSSTILESPLVLGAIYQYI